MPDKTKGLFNKFKVERTDGKSAPGEKHADCSYFVLDVSCDPFAIPALMSYIRACEKQYPALARDLLKQAQMHCEHVATDTVYGPDTIGKHCCICEVDMTQDYDE